MVALTSEQQYLEDHDHELLNTSDHIATLYKTQVRIPLILFEKNQITLAASLSNGIIATHPVLIPMQIRPRPYQRF